jgi:hypothetical protein
VKILTLPQFLTKDQIRKATRLYKKFGTNAVSQIRAEVIEPNMAAINAKIGQENDARYLAYAVVYVLSQGTTESPV